MLKLILPLLLASTLVTATTFQDLNESDFRGYYSEDFPDSWKRKGGCYHLDSYGFGADLMTKRKFIAFELEFEWSLEKGGNSGILFAVQEGEYYSYLSGLEIQLLDDSNHPDGKFGLTGLGALYGLSAPNLIAKKELKMEKLNRSLLIVKNGQVKFYVNDTLIAEHSLKDHDLQAEI